MELPPSIRIRVFLLSHGFSPHAYHLQRIISHVNLLQSVTNTREMRGAMRGVGALLVSRGFVNARGIGPHA
jgi:hypothetical protein